MTRPDGQHASSLSQRSYYLDALNIIACFAVTLLHASNSVFLNSGDGYWHACAVTQSVCIFAVPIFLMISGANLIGYRNRYSTLDFFRKRASRIVGVFLGCSIMFYLIECFIPEPFGYITREFSIPEFVQGFLGNDINDTYWYFYAVIGLYALCPIVSIIANRPKLALYLCLLCFVTTIAFPFLGRFANDYNPFNNFTYPYFSSWLLYFVMGYYLAHHFNRRIPSSLLAIIFIASVAASAFLTIRINTPLQSLGEEYVGYYAGAFSPLEFLAICSLFLLFKNLSRAIALPSLRKPLIAFSALSLGVYAIQILPLRFIDVVFPVMQESIVIKALIIYFVSALLTWTWHKCTGALRATISHRRMH